MKYRPLGDTGIRTSEVGYGAWAVGGNAHGNSYGPTDDKESAAAIARALELGCNFFDTADVYGHGHSEELLGRSLKNRPRTELVIATKVGGDFYHGTPRMNFDPDYIEYFAIEKSLERLETSYIDLYQLHNPPLQLIRNPKLYEPLERLKKAGKILHFGVSIHDPKEGLEAMKYGKPGAIQVVFNILRQEAKNELFDKARERGVGIIAREPLSNGFLTGKYDSHSRFPRGDIRYGFPDSYREQLISAVDKLRFLQSKDRTLTQASIRFVLDHQEVSTVIPGIKTTAQAEEDLRASELSSLTGEELLRVKYLREQGFE